MNTVPCFAKSKAKGKSAIQRLADGSGKHGEGLWVGFVPALQQTAATEAAKRTAVDSPK
jgi:hypothetical protein